MRRTSPEQLKKINAWRAERQREPGFFLSGEFPTANRRVHWSIKKEQRGNGKIVADKMRNMLPKSDRYQVTFTRYSNQKADDDNVRMAAKALRDGIADSFVTNDSEKSILSWKYEQELAPKGAHGMRIVIEAKE